MNRKTLLTLGAALVVGLVVGYLIRGGGAPGPGEMAGDGAAPRQEATLKMASAYAATLPIVGTGGVYLTEVVDDLSEGSLTLQHYDPGKLVPALEVFEAVSRGAVDAGFSTAAFWFGKMPAAAIFSSIPFGPDNTEFLAWLFQGEGLKFYQELYARHNVWVYPCGMIPPEASGWFREEITSLDQFDGMKIRFFGLGGRAIQRLGASVQLLAPGDIYPALERGVIDATELSVPVMDEKLGFHQVAKHYYFPGWHQQSTTTELLVNMDRWNELSPRHQAVLRSACNDVTLRNITLGETVQGDSIRRMREEGVQVHYWDDRFLEAFREASLAELNELAADDADFKRYYESLQSFREEFQLWADLSRLPEK